MGCVVTMAAAPMLGGAAVHPGERTRLAFEYLGLAGVLLAYGGIQWRGWRVVLVAMLHVLDHLLFARGLAAPADRRIYRCASIQSSMTSSPAS